MTGAADLVWYVSYGSNLSSARFRVYLEGGTVPGRSRPQVGARDRALWRDSRGVTLPHRLIFAGESLVWGGGVAFVDPVADRSVTLACAYLVTVEQFQDVLAQESGREVGSEVDLGDVFDGGSTVVGEGKYDRVVNVGHHDWPMLTFTTPGPVAALQRNPPAVAYRETIVAGVVESHGLDHEDARRYVRDRAD